VGVVLIENSNIYIIVITLNFLQWKLQAK